MRGAAVAERLHCHTWASRHVQSGTPLFALQQLGGWESPEMVRRYAHLSAEHLAPHAERLCTLRAVESSDYGTNTAQPENIKGPPFGKPLIDW